MDVDQQNQKLRRLVPERQAHPARGAASDEVERKRLEIVPVQWKLLYASSELHSPELDTAA